MSGPKRGKRVELRHLKRGQAVPCDGRIYCDKAGRLWFGLQHPLEEEGHYRRLLAQVAKHEKKRRKKK